MALYVNVPIETDPDAVTQDAFDYMAAKTGGLWKPHDAQLDTWQLSATGRMAANLKDYASDIGAGIFRYFGTLVGIPPIDAVAATATVQITTADANGYTVPAGTAMAIPDAAGNLIDFTSTADLVIAPGSTTGLVQIAAVEEGAAASGIGTTGGPVQMLDALAFVSGVTLQAPTGGGSDAEVDEDYLNRLATNLQLMSPRPILPGDFAVLARNYAGVGRALALDGYDAVALTNGNARTITVALVDLLGNAVSTGVLNTVATSLAAMREANFLVYAINPTYTTIDVLFDVNAWPGIDKTALNASIVSAIQAYYNPATWGNPGYGDQLLWYNVTTAKINDLIGIVKQVSGVQDVNSVTQRINPAAFAAADIALAGAAPLPLSGVVSGTVH